MTVFKNDPCAATCAIARGRFLRSAGLAALAGVGGAALLAYPAFAQSVGSIAPSQSHGKLLTYPTPTREGALVDGANGVILARVKNAVYAMSIACPHRSMRPAIEDPCTRNSSGSAAPPDAAVTRDTGRLRYIASFTVPLSAQYSVLAIIASDAASAAPAGGVPEMSAAAPGTNAPAPTAAAN